MLGIDEIKELAVRVKPNGRAIEILINGEKIDDKRYLKGVEKIGFEFEKEEDGFITVSCTRTTREVAYPEKKRAAAARARVRAAERDKNLRDKFGDEITNLD